jgi:hypothetical protein
MTEVASVENPFGRVLGRTSWIGPPHRLTATEYASVRIVAILSYCPIPSHACLASCSNSATVERDSKLQRLRRYEIAEIAAQRLIDYAARLSDAEKYLTEDVDTFVPGAIRFRDDLLEMRSLPVTSRRDIASCSGSGWRSGAPTRPIDAFGPEGLERHRVA